MAILIKMKTIKMKNLTMKLALRGALVTMTLLASSGCGLKGPLYFPSEQKSSESKVVVPNSDTILSGQKVISPSA